MRIGLDASAIYGPMSKNRGIGNYCTDLLEALLRCCPQHEFFLLNISEDTPFAAGVQQRARLHEEYIYLPLKNEGISSEDRRELFGDVVRSFVTRFQLDVFVVTSPFDVTYPTYSREWFGETAVVAIVYDIIPYIFKERYLGDKNAFDWYMSCVDFLRTADRLCVISQSVKDDLCSYLDFPGDNIDVIWGAVGRRFKEFPVPEERKNALAAQYGIRDGFIICTGGDDDRKNIDGLITAYAALPKDTRRQHQLVVVCKLSPASMERYKALAQRRGAAEDVVLTGFVSDSELVELYNLAALCAFVSRYEGFGLPIVEAWRCGTPVVTADNSSLVQLAGDAAVVVNADSRQSITNGLSSALERLPDLTRRGKERAKRFTWEQSVADMMGSVEIIEKQRSAAPRRRLAVFTPMPPQQSGIADYSYDIIERLRKYYDIDVFVEDTAKVDALPREMTGVAILSHKSYRPSEYAHTVFEVGNSDFHYYMYPYIQKGADIIELHDLNLYYAARHFSTIDPTVPFDRWLDMECAENKASDPPLMNSFLVDCAQKVIVHSGYAKRHLLRSDFSRQVRFLPHYAMLKPMKEDDHRKARQRLSLPQDAMILAAFGFIHETKRSIPTLHAFRRLLDRCGDRDIRLLYVGKLPQELEEVFPQEVERLKLQDKVTVTGFTELSEFLDYIDAADLSINLRYPSNGETSGVLMRTLARGKAIMVSDIGSFAEIPEDCCIRIPSAEGMTLEEESAVIAKALQDFVQSREMRSRLERNARSFAERAIEIDTVTKRLVRFIEEPVHPRRSGEWYDRIIAAEKAQAGNVCTLQQLMDTLAFSKNPFGDDYIPEEDEE
ncbi:MAG: glycosyltransferase [Ruminococcaceae bacterium]|nr:glycosyltransferase [Oscillospiraceae bacterium]